MIKQEILNMIQNLLNDGYIEIKPAMKECRSFKLGNSRIDINLKEAR